MTEDSRKMEIIRQWMYNFFTLHSETHKNIIVEKTFKKNPNWGIPTLKENLRA